MPFEATSTLNIAYEAGGPPDGFPVVLLHLDVHSCSINDVGRASFAMFVESIPFKASRTAAQHRRVMGAGGTPEADCEA
jgi:hypothetical protein